MTVTPDKRSPPASKRARKTKHQLLYDQLANASEEPPAPSNEVSITPDLRLPLDQSVLDTFFYWCNERHRIHQRRAEGKPQSEWTNDPILRSNKFANVFRALDRGTQFVLTDVIAKGSQTLEECCFRVILYRSFARISTYQLITEALGGPPSYRSFTPELYENILLPHVGAGKPIYGSSYFIPAPKEFKSQYPFQSTLRLISLMMRTELPQKLAELKHMRDAHSIICVYPAIGAFLGMQLLLDLNLTPHIDVSEDEYAACGPGSRSCLVSMFGNYVQGFELQAMQWIFREQHHHWRRLGITSPPRLCDARPAGISMVDIEHALCEVHKYMRARDRKVSGRPSKRGTRASTARQKSAAAARAVSAAPAPTAPAADGTDGLSFDKIKGEGALSADGEPVAAVDGKSSFYSLSDDELTSVLPAKWLVPRQEKVYERPPPITIHVDDDDDETGRRATSPVSPTAADAEAGEVYEISHIVTMTPASRKCLVRWKGFGPEEDTWEDYDELVNGDARESVEAYVGWLDRVADEIPKMQKEAEEERERLKNAKLEELIALPIAGGSGGGSGLTTRRDTMKEAATNQNQNQTGRDAQLATRLMGLPLAGSFGIV